MIIFRDTQKSLAGHLEDVLTALLPCDLEVKSLGTDGELVFTPHTTARRAWLGIVCQRVPTQGGGICAYQRGLNGGKEWDMPNRKSALAGH